MSNIKDNILFHLKNKDVDSLKKELATIENVDILYIIKELKQEEQAIVYRLLAKETALFVFEQLDTTFQQKLLNSFTDEKAIEVFSELEPDDCVKLLEELPATVAKKLIDSLSFEDRQAINILLGYEVETAGRVMTTKYVALKRDEVADDALNKIKRIAKDKETIYTLYVTDNTRKLEGVLSLADLLMAEPNTKIEDIMNKKVIKVYTNTDQEEVAKILKEFDFLAIPVVDKEDLLVGIVTIDDAIDILQEEAVEDMFNKAGLSDITRTEASRSDLLINGTILQNWKVRVPFLVITLIGGLLAGIVIQGFSDTLEAIAVVAVFIPLIMDMGGNVGTQSSTIFARALVMGHIKLETIGKHLLKELRIGFSIGALVGIVSGVIAAIWQGMPELGLAVGLALAITMSLSTLLGFLVPYILVRLNLDQATGADPIITSIKDVTGLLIYFVLVNIFMGHMM
jgi:magnesium transporter